MDRPLILLVATTNPGKAGEVHLGLRDLPLTLETLEHYPSLQAPVEDAPTFEGNARLKALYYAALTGRWTLADDSGLEVDALDGQPGVLSSRFAGRGGDDQANNAKLIAALASVPQDRRTARFRCVLALARPGEVILTAEGSVEGSIIDQGRGSNGFGYDPHFLLPDLGKTAAELRPEEKNRISHRGQAVRSLRAKLGSLRLAGEHPE